MRLTGCRYARVLVPQDDDSDVFARSSSQGTRDPGARVRQKLFAAILSSTPKGSDRPTSQKKWHWSRDVGSCFSEYQPPTDPTQSAARTSEATLPLSWTKNCTGGTSFFREGSCCEGRCDAVKHAWATSGGNCRCPGVQWLQGNGKIGEALCAPTRTGDTSLEMTCCLNFASCDNDCPRICGDLDLF